MTMDKADSKIYGSLGSIASLWCGGSMQDAVDTLIIIREDGDEND